MTVGVTKPATPAAGAGGPVAAISQIESAPTLSPDSVEIQRIERQPREDTRLATDTTIADRYRIIRVLGEGGMGVVYAAEHVLMRKEVALKVLHAEMCSLPEVVARFEREAIAAAAIDHPNVAGATDFGRLADGSCYLVLELLRGASLRDEIAKGPIPRERALRLLRGITSGVSAAHAKGIVHRDLKPENVMLVEREGTFDFVKVLDFGIAKVDPSIASSPQSVGKVLTRVGAVFGTPEYMAPEQAVGDTVDARADLYALGVMLLEMLTGKCPFQGNAMSILRERILAVGPPDMSAVPDEDVRALVARLLARQPEDRVQTANELVVTIDELLAPLSPAARGQRGSAPCPPSLHGLSVGGVVEDLPEATVGGRHWLVPAAVALGALALGAGLIFAFARPTATRNVAAPTLSVPVPTVREEAPPSSAAAEEPEPPKAEPEPAPAPTASAASARAAPRGKPRPRPRTNKGIPIIKDLLK